MCKDASLPRKKLRSRKSLPAPKFSEIGTLAVHVVWDDERVFNKNR